MNCHATRAVLDLHAEGRLTQSRAKTVAAHLASCSECRGRTAALTAVAVKAPAGDFKARLAAAMKTARVASAARPTPELALWPRDLSGVAFAAAALAVIALAIGWSGVPSQFDAEDAEFAAGRIP